MAISFKDQPSGFDYYKDISPDELFYVPGIPGTTYTKDNVLTKNAIGATANAGLFAASADSGAAPLLQVVKTVTCPAATTSGFPRGGRSQRSLLSAEDNVANSLVPCRLIRGHGVRVFRAPFEGYADQAVAGYNASTPSLTATTSFGANDDPNGGLIFIYDGPGAGQWNWVVDYDHGTKVMTLARKFEVAPTTSSSFIVLEGQGSSAGGVGILGRVDSADHDAVDVDDGVDDGDWIVVLDARIVKEALEGGWLPVALYSEFV